jgi:hypothetical protein
MIPAPQVIRVRLRHPRSFSVAQKRTTADFADDAVGRRERCSLVPPYVLLSTHRRT